MPRTKATRGRKPDASSKSGQIRALLGSGMSAAEIAKKVGATPALVYNVKAQAGKSGRRGPGRPRKVAVANMNGLGGLLDAVRNTERDRAKMRAALEKLQMVIADALA